MEGSLFVGSALNIVQDMNNACQWYKTMEQLNTGTMKTVSDNIIMITVERFRLDTKI